MEACDSPRVLLVELDDAELVGEGDRLANRGDRDARTGLDVGLDHLGEVHAVDVVGADDDDDVGSLIPQQVEALQDRVRGSREPALAEPLLGGNGCDVGTRDAVEAPGLRDVAVEAVRLVLGQHDDLAKPRVDQVAEREVDEAITAAEGNCGFGPIRGERHEPFTLATSKYYSEDLL